MEDDSATGDREAVVTAAVSALRDIFGSRACVVAECQRNTATDEALASWTEILERLRSDRDCRK